MPLPLPRTVIDGRDATEIPPNMPDAPGIGENMAGTRRYLKAVEEWKGFEPSIHLDSA
jgi:hypothetical protein